MLGDGPQKPPENRGGVSPLAWMRRGIRTLARLATRRTLQRLAESEHALAESQRLASIGSFELDAESGVMTWSDELYRIFALQPGGGALTYHSWLGSFHPDD